MDIVERLRSPHLATRESHDAIAEIERLREALHRISLGSQNSGTTKESLGAEARKALGEKNNDEND